MIDIEEIVSKTLKQIKSAILDVNKKVEFAKLPTTIEFDLVDPMTHRFKFNVNLHDYTESEKMDNKQMKKHSDAKQDKKLINKIVDKKIATATRADKRQDAKMLKRVVKKPTKR